MLKRWNYKRPRIKVHRVCVQICYVCIERFHADSAAFPERWHVVDFHPCVKFLWGWSPIEPPSSVDTQAVKAPDWENKEPMPALSICVLCNSQSLVRGAQQRPEAIKLFLGFLGTELPALRTDSPVLAARLDNGGIRELPRLKVSEIKQWVEAKLQTCADSDRLCGGCRRTQPGLILSPMPKGTRIRMGQGCGAPSEKAHPSVLGHLFQLQRMGGAQPHKVCRCLGRGRQGVGCWGKKIHDTANLGRWKWHLEKVTSKNEGERKLQHSALHRTHTPTLRENVKGYLKTQEHLGRKWLLRITLPAEIC